MKSNGDLSIFIIEDDKLMSTSIKNEIVNCFAGENVHISTFDVGEESLIKLSEKPDIVIADFYLNSRQPNAMNGINLLNVIRNRNPKTQVVLLTREENLNLARLAFRNGAYDYIVKGDDMFQRLHLSLRQCANVMDLNGQRRKRKRRSMTLLFLAALVSAVTIQILAPHLL